MRFTVLPIGQQDSSRHFLRSRLRVVRSNRRRRRARHALAIRWAGAACRIEPGVRPTEEIAAGASAPSRANVIQHHPGASSAVTSWKRFRRKCPRTRSCLQSARRKSRRFCSAGGPGSPRGLSRCSIMRPRHERGPQGSADLDARPHEPGEAARHGRGRSEAGGSQAAGLHQPFSSTPRPGPAAPRASRPSTRGSSSRAPRGTNHGGDAAGQAPFLTRRRPRAPSAPAPSRETPARSASPAATAGTR